MALIVLLGNIGCVQTQTRPSGDYEEFAITEASLTQPQWKLFSLYSERYILPNMPYLRFSEGRVTGFDGCNRLIADYTLDEPELTFGLITSTKKACSTQFIEQLLHQAMRETRYAYSKAGVLKLLNESRATIAVFKATAVQPLESEPLTEPAPEPQPEPQIETEPQIPVEPEPETFTETESEPTRTSTLREITF